MVIARREAPHDGAPNSRHVRQPALTLSGACGLCET